MYSYEIISPLLTICIIFVILVSSFLVNTFWFVVDSASGIKISNPISWMSSVFLRNSFVIVTYKVTDVLQILNMWLQQNIGKHRRTLYVCRDEAEGWNRSLPFITGELEYMLLWPYRNFRQTNRFLWSGSISNLG